MCVRACVFHSLVLFMLLRVADATNKTLYVERRLTCIYI